MSTGQVSLEVERRFVARLGWPRKFSLLPTLSAFVVVITVVLAMGGKQLSPYDPNDINLASVEAKPNTDHWLGTDNLGRDAVSRIIAGARTTVLVSFLSVAISLTLGSGLGMISGIVRGWWDLLIMRFMDALWSIPTIVLALAITAAVGRGLLVVAAAVAISVTPIFARLARAQTLTVAANDYILAARAVGVPAHRLIVRHIVPNIADALIVQASLLMSSAIIVEAALSFLGAGVVPPQASWGGMLRGAYNHLETAPHVVIPPLVAIGVLVVSINILGDYLRDRLDVRL